MFAILGVLVVKSGVHSVELLLPTFGFQVFKRNDDSIVELVRHDVVQRANNIQGGVVFLCEFADASFVFLWNAFRDWDPFCSVVSRVRGRCL